MDFKEKIVLGRTGLRVSRLGLGASYPAPAAAFEEAFERGVNYFYWGSRRSEPMGSVIRQLAPRHRDELVLVVQSYARVGFLVKLSIERALKKLGVDHIDVLLLGWYNGAPGRGIIDAAMELREQGRIRHVALSGHNRKLFPTLLDDERYGAWHVRYNAVHRGAEREVFPALDGRPVDKRPGVITFTTTRWGHLCDPRRTAQGERTPTGTDCYRFALSNPHVDLALSGPANAEQMQQALAALELGPMNDEELAWMRRVGDHIYGRDRTSGVRDGV